MKITQKEFDKFFETNVLLSDMDFGRDENGEFTVPMIEWDGIYGKHWSRYDTEEDRQFALDQYEIGLESWVKAYRVKVQWEKEQKEKETQKIEGLKTIGGMFPELEELKSKMK